MGFDMSFEHVYEAVSYRDHLNATGSRGNCLGQSWLWMTDILAGSAISLAPACFLKGDVLQKEYLQHVARGGACVVDMGFYIQKGRELQGSARGRCLVQRNASGNASAFEMVNAFARNAQGDAGMIMTWNISDKRKRLSYHDEDYESGHAVALLRLNDEGKIYLYDPNTGVHEWHEAVGVNLYTDIERYLMARSRRAVFLSCVSMFSRQGVSPLNFRKVYV